MFRNEQITTLCNQLLKANTEDDVLRLASLLQAALHEHLETIRGNLLVSIPQSVPEETIQNPELES